MTGRRESRKRAYHYIVTQAQKLNINFNYRSDKTITDINYIAPNDLEGLKEGIADPPQKLVAALRKLLKYVASEAEIEENLIKPFRPKT